jgi:ZIP family zinc transporter
LKRHLGKININRKTIKMDIVVIALLLSLLAGLSTTIGSIFVFIIKTPKPTIISFIMGFSAGVMILVSFVELLPASIEANGLLIAQLYFFLGMIIMFLVDIKISHYYEFEYKNGELNSKLNHKGNGNNSNPQDLLVDQNHQPKHHRRHKHQHRYQHQNPQHKSLKKTSLLIAIGIFIHNFPEGMATFIATLKEVELGVLLTIAITLHNIPEGIAVAIPVYASTDSNKKKAFLWSFITGLSEPLGAIVVWLILFPFINDFVINAMLAVVAGFMIYISLDELLPVSRSLGKEHISILGIISGMFVMTISLILI